MKTCPIYTGALNLGVAMAIGQSHRTFEFLSSSHPEVVCCMRVTNSPRIATEPVADDSIFSNHIFLNDSFAWYASAIWWGLLIFSQGIFIYFPSLHPYQNIYIYKSRICSKCSRGCSASQFCKLIGLRKMETVIQTNNRWKFELLINLYDIRYWNLEIFKNFV